MKILALSLLLLLTCSGLSFSQSSSEQKKADDPAATQDQEETSDPNDKEGPADIWQATLDGGEYLVLLNSISSVSRHKYVLDGTLIVDEVTIDTIGQGLVRFYYISPITSALPGATAAQITESALKLVDKVTQTAGTNLQNMVVKKFPLTTHSKTIEYRILSEAQLTSLFKSAKKAWITRKGRLFTTK